MKSESFDVEVTSGPVFSCSLSDPPSTLTMTEDEIKTINMDVTLVNWSNNNQLVMMDKYGVRPSGITGLDYSLSQENFTTNGPLVLTITAPSGSASSIAHTVTVTAICIRGPNSTSSSIKNIDVTVSRVGKRIIVEPTDLRFDAVEGGQEQSGALRIRMSDGSTFTPTVRKVGGAVARWLNCQAASVGYALAECTASPR